MTDTDTTKADVIAALLADLDFLDTLRTTARARGERPFFNMAGDRIGVNPLAATGRVQVSPGQTISSASWGNPVWDQSINVFADAPSRDSQWPSPHEGSECYTLDTSSPWVYRAGAWHGRPKGYVASVLGPASQVNCATTGTQLLALTATLVLGRRYLVTGSVLGTQTTAGAGPRTDLGGVDAGSRIVWGGASVIANGVVGGGFANQLTPNATGARTVTLTGYAGVGTFNIGPGNAELVITDIGG